MEYLFDTDICIFLIRSKPTNLLNRLQKLPFGSVGISTITLAELQVGVNKSSNPAKNSEALLNFLTAIDIVDFDFHAAIEYGNIRCELEKKGTPIGPLDTLIAAHAKSLVVTLVTNNMREFKRVNGLKIENWND
jgi:tRNA(fMet)-specific endonuclease VapC